jgi:Tol biopolymer transport system component
VGVFTVWEAPPFRIEAIRISTGERKVLTPGFKSYVTSTGHLVFASQDGEILAAPFDAENMELTGAAVPLVEGVSLDANAYPIFSLSESGALVYLTGSAGGLSEFVWVDRSGQETPVHPGYTFSLPINWGLRLSPDETRVVFNSVVDGNNDVRIKHLPDGPEERITFSEDNDYRPLWTPDGQTVTYFSGSSTTDHNVWSRRADGTGEAVLLLDDVRSLNHGSWSPDGEWLVFRSAATQAMGLGLRDVLAFRPGVDSAADTPGGITRLRRGCASGVTRRRLARVQLQRDGP